MTRATLHSLLSASSLSLYFCISSSYPLSINHIHLSQPIPSCHVCRVCVACMLYCACLLCGCCCCCCCACLLWLLLWYLLCWCGAQEAKIAREMRVEEHQRRVKEITTAVMEVVGLCAEHREMVQLRLGEVPTLGNPNPIPSPYPTPSPYPSRNNLALLLT